MKKKCEHIIAFHWGHNPLTKKDYLNAKKNDDLNCCGGTEVLTYCPKCGKRLRCEVKK